MTDRVFVRVWELPADERAAVTHGFHDGVYREGFPEPDETETAETWLPLMEADAPPESPRVFLIVARGPDGRILGGIVFEQYRGIGVWLLTYITVTQTHRGEGLARGLMDAMLGVIADAGAGSPWSLLAEMEKPERRAPAEREAAFRRLSTLSHLGFWRLGTAYVQPALGPGQTQLDTLDLLQWVSGGTDEPDPIAPSALSAFLRGLYGSLGQKDDPSLLTMLVAIATNGVGGLHRLTAPPATTTRWAPPARSRCG